MGGWVPRSGQNWDEQDSLGYAVVYSIGTRVPIRYSLTWHILVICLKLISDINTLQRLQEYGS